MNLRHPLDAIPQGWPAWVAFAALPAPFPAVGRKTTPGLWGLAGLFAGLFRAAGG